MSKVRKYKRKKQKTIAPIGKIFDCDNFIINGFFIKRKKSVHCIFFNIEFKKNQSFSRLPPFSKDRKTFNFDVTPPDSVLS